jgi:hypothetical protein
VKLYAVCWQDECEPWGWAPLAVAPQFFWTREEAEARLEEAIDQEAREYATAYEERTVSEKVAREWAESTLSIQEYDVPDPPQANGLSIANGYLKGARTERDRLSEAILDHCRERYSAGEVARPWDTKLYDARAGIVDPPEEKPAWPDEMRPE